MTELDAPERAAYDVLRIRKRIEKGDFPDRIQARMTKLLVSRVDSFENREASQLARRRAAEQRSAATSSELLLAQWHAVIRSVIPTLPPEDSRALIIWTIGSSTPGVLTATIPMLGESSGVEALERVVADLEAVMQQMAHADQVLFKDRIKDLSRARRRIVKGMILDARWALSEGDGESYRSRILQARKLALRWVRQNDWNLELGLSLPFINPVGL